MNIILFTHVHGRPGSLNLSRPRVYLPLSALALVVASLLVFAGYQWGAAGSAGEPGMLADWRADMQAQRRAVEQARRDSEAHLDALALRLGQLQGQVMRLEGLGQRLVAMAKLEKGEFDFASPPPQGGPEQGAAVTSYAVPDFMAELDALSRLLDDREQQLVALESLLLDKELSKRGRPTGRPVRSGWMSSPFGKRTDPFTGRKAWHEGVDFAGKLGSDVLAVAGGVVTWAGKRSGYGLLVEINHGNGYVTRYGHNRELLVKVGDTVQPGQTIAHMGSSGRSTGPHVHFEILRHGKPINPARFVWARR
ncbi:M23 family metallopeptidase [Thiohalobacter sp. IOR34]|uniref:M23 family metallopeptidase n=1 Tax=Thiohalobacter sp. IOR34 TaxID=3057176 RepID=UPI0025B19486|nr:M23 family metallopeptidase [Thiohalobacter sp. IOR34]WJW74944.1 M23 family metallopeptidase [Thiohalobacter sp. IOR34]